MTGEGIDTSKGAALAAVNAVQRELSSQLERMPPA